jgi:hypothetical protein
MVIMRKSEYLRKVESYIAENGYLERKKDHAKKFVSFPITRYFNNL